MINLVKNELYKIFKKKGIKILCFVVLAICAINFGAIKFVNNFSDSLLSDGYIQNLEDGLSSYNLNDPTELGWYVSDRITIDTHNYLKEYDANSWQRAILEDRIGEDITCVINADISKQTELYNECKGRLDSLKLEVNSHDWKYFVNEKLNALKEEKNNVEALILTASEEEKYELELSLKVIDIQIEGEQYRLDNDIPYGNTRESSIIEEYVDLGSRYLTMNSKKVKNSSEIAIERESEKNYNIAKYRLDNNIGVNEEMTANEYLCFDIAIIALIIVVMIALISSSSMTDEFSNGTIKQLLLRPYSRGKILASKFIASFIVFILFAIYYYTVYAITYGLALGFDSFFVPVLVYDFSISAVRELNIVTYCIINFAAFIPYYVVIMLVAFAFGTITGNGGASLAGTIVFHSAIEIVNLMFEMVNKKWMQFFPTLCFDWSYYLFGGVSAYPYCELWSSVLVTILTIVVLGFITYIVFKKKDIKNQ